MPLTRDASSNATQLASSGCPPATTDPTMQLTATVDGVTLTATLEDGTIAQLTHTGATDGSLLRALNALCAVAVGLPMPEAADHGALRAMYRVLGSVRTVSGILTPRSAGPEFAFVERLIRGVHGKFLVVAGVTVGANTYQDPISPEWAKLPQDAKVRRLTEIAQTCARDAHLAEDVACVEHVERHVRVTIGVAASLERSEWPGLMRRLERAMRAETGEPIELFLSERTDENELRRLKTVA